MNIKALVAEFIGVFTLCFVGIAAIHHLGAVPGGLLGIALAHGLAIAVMVSATGHISGGHLNPAVTVAALVGGKIKPVEAVGYIVSQCLAGVVASLVVMAVLPGGQETIANGTPAVGKGVGISMALVAEIVTTFFLAFVVYGTGIDPRGPKVGGLFIGLTVTVGILAVGPISGGALNPARHLGPALVSGDGAKMAEIWLYWLGPVIGGAIAGLLYSKVLEAPAKPQTK